MYRKRILATGIGLCTAIIALLLLTMMTVGMANAALVGGVGGFLIQADQITADNVLIYVDSGAVTAPGGQNQPNVSNYPLLHLELDSTTITNLTLTKTIDDPLNQGKEMCLIISQHGASAPPGPKQVQTGQTLLKTSSFQANVSEFNGLQVRQRATADPTRKLNVTAGNNASDLPVSNITSQEINITGPASGEPGINITDPDIRAHYLTTSRLSLNELNLGIRYYNSSQPRCSK